jgi:hypothetical protein
VPQEKIPPKERIASSFKQLAAVSNELNQSADQLAKAVASLEFRLQRIGVGVPAWHCIAGHDEGEDYWTRDVGYTQIGNEWKIAIRKTSGHHQAESHSEQVWAFGNAPKWMAVEAVSKLPDLFDELVSRTIDTTKKLKARTNDAIELGSAIDQLFAKPVTTEVGEKE